MNNSIDQQFIEFDEKGVLLELTVDPEDLGRVIGKRGATAQSLRTLLRALGTKNDARYNLKIIDNGEPMHRSNDSPAPTSPSSDDNAVSTPTTSETPEHGKGDSDTLKKTRAELEDLDDLDV